MKQVSIAALTLALTLGVAAGPAMAKEKEVKEAPAKPSDAIIKAAPAAEAASKAKDWAKLKDAASPLVPQIKNNDDKLYVGQWLVQAGQGLSDQALLGQGIDLMLDSGKAPASAVGQLSFVQGQLAYQAKDYPKAVKGMQQAAAAGWTDPNIYPIMIEAMRAQGQSAEALKILTDQTQKSIAAGKPVPSEWYERGFSIAYGAKPTDPNYAATRKAGIDLAKNWAASYPQGKVWHDTVLLYRESVQEDADLKLDINRFLLASGGLVGANDYLEYAETVYLRYPGEAKAVLDAGVKSGKLNLASNRNATEINQIVTGKTAADKASLPASEKSARAGGNAKSALATADAFYSYGDYAKAIDLYTLAGTKGADANLVATRVGEAQYMSGDKAAAKATFAKVTGPRKNLADFWTVLIDHPSQG